jgi:hypothetical protein
VVRPEQLHSRRFEKSVMLPRLDQFHQLREALMLNPIPPLASAFVGGVLLYLSIYLPIQSIILPTILAGVGTMALAYSYGTLRHITR